jgi:hypothetical protein
VVKGETVQTRRTPDEPIVGLSDLTLGDFWSWAYSDLLTNATRSVFGEFLVAVALGLTDTPRVAWDVADFRYREKLIEVKTSGYLQSWSVAAKRLPSRIVYSVAKTHPWELSAPTWESELRRPADCYVFCLYTETEHAAAHPNVHDVSRWVFYVLATSLVDQRWGDQKSVGLAQIQAVAVPVPFARLREQIDGVLGFLADDKAPESESDRGSDVGQPSI